MKSIKCQYQHVNIILINKLFKKINFIIKLLLKFRRHHILNIYSPYNHQVTPVGTPANRIPMQSSSNPHKHLELLCSQQKIPNRAGGIPKQFTCIPKYYYVYVYQKRLITFYASGKITWLSSGLRQLGQLWGLHGDFETISKRGVATYVESPVFPKLPSCHPLSWGCLMGQRYSAGNQHEVQMTQFLQINF